MNNLRLKKQKSFFIFHIILEQDITIYLISLKRNPALYNIWLSLHGTRKNNSPHHLVKYVHKQL